MGSAHSPQGSRHVRSGGLEVEFQNRRLRAGATDEDVTLTAFRIEDLVSMLGFAGEIGRHAGSAIAVFAGGIDLNALSPQNADDRFADRHFVFGAGARKPDAERLVLGGDRKSTRLNSSH